MQTFFIYTLGCRANQADSAAMCQELERHNLAMAESYRDADFVILNSCTVTHRADHEARSLLRRIRRENPRARLIVTGCYAQRKPEELAAIDGVEFVIGNSGKENIADIILKHDGAYCGGVRVFHDDIQKERHLRLASFMETGGKTRPFIKIQDGCDAHCSYCIIPSVRGKGRSAEPDEVIERARQLVAAGFKEIVLTGIHLGTYGSKLEPRTTLAELIKRMLDETDIERIRIGSIEPMRFSFDIVDLAASSARIARHFHLPLQSGSNRILRLMQRAYTAERYAEIVGYIRQRIPDASIGTDVIVGFPSETEEEHELTYKFIESSPLTYLHVFSFSKREGTTAATLPGEVDSKTIKRRSQELRSLSRSKNLAFRKRFLGRTLSVLTLNEENEDPRWLSALSDNYFKVKVPRGNIEPNQIIDVLVMEVRDEYIVAAHHRDLESTEK